MLNKGAFFAQKEPFKNNIITFGHYQQPQLMKTYSFDSLNEIADGDQDFIRSIVEAFLEEIPEDLEAMLSAAENQNKKLVYYYAHKMKPNLKMLGLHLEDNIKELQAWSGSTQNISKAQEHIDKISSTLEKTFGELKEDFDL